MPTINIKAVKLAIGLGLGLKCKINKTTGFSRKHYYYPDLPKGYQITQFNTPLCESGYVSIDDSDIKQIGITRAHLEEDAGKTIHSLERVLTAESVGIPPMATYQDCASFVVFLIFV